MATSPTLSIPTPRRDISCQELVKSSAVAHHGFLRRRKMVNKMMEEVTKGTQIIKWPRIYVVLHGGCLYQFKDELSLQPKEATSLFGFTQIGWCSEEVSSEATWPFKVVNALDCKKERAFYFSAAFQGDAEKWLEHMHQQMVLANSATVQVTSVQGSPPAMKLPAMCPFPPSAECAKATPMKRDDKPTPRPRLQPPVPEVPPDDPDDDQYDRIDEIRAKGAKRQPGDRLVTDLKRGFKSLMQRQGSAGNTPPAETSAATDDQPQTNTGASRPLPATPTSPKEKPMTAVKPQPPRTTPKPAVSPRTALSPAKSQTSTDEPIGYTEFQGPEASVYDDAGLENNVQTDTTSKAAAYVLEPAIMDAYWNKSANEGETLMKNLATEGGYMIRESNEPGKLTLLVKTDGCVRKYKLQTDHAGKMHIDATGPRFDSCAALISFYKANLLPGRAEKLKISYKQCK